MVEGPHSEEEIRQAKEYMRTTPLDAQEKANNNRGLMLDKILLTHASQREYLKREKCCVIHISKQISTLEGHARSCIFIRPFYIYTNLMSFLC